MVAVGKTFEMFKDYFSQKSIHPRIFFRIDFHGSEISGPFFFFLFLCNIIMNTIRKLKNNKKKKKKKKKKKSLQVKFQPKSRTNDILWVLLLWNRLDWIALQAVLERATPYITWSCYRAIWNMICKIELHFILRCNNNLLVMRMLFIRVFLVGWFFMVYQPL